MKGSASLVAALTPLKVFLRRFAYVLLVGAAVGLMLIGKIETVIIEGARSRMADAVTPILDTVSKPVAALRGFAGHVGELAVLREENQRLRREHATLLQWQLLARRLEDENRSLRDLLNFHPGPTASYITARVVADTGGAFVRSVLINAGTRDGVARGQAVVSGEGLVGRVTQAGDRSARVLLMTDLNSRIPVVVGEARKRAILAGDNSDNPRLIYADAKTPLDAGELIVTSGEGGVFKPGLPIGVVAGPLGRGVAVQTFVDWGRVEYVRVVDYGVRAPAEAAVQ